MSAFGPKQTWVLRCECLLSPPEDNLGYHAFRDKEQAQREASWHGWYPAVIGSVAMWGEVVEHQLGWRSEYAAVRSLTEITGDSSFSTKHWLLEELREKYCCKVVTDYERRRITVLSDDWLTRMDESSRRIEWPATRAMPQHAANIGKSKRTRERSMTEAPARQYPLGL